MKNRILLALILGTTFSNALPKGCRDVLLEKVKDVLLVELFFEFIDSLNKRRQNNQSLNKNSKDNESLKQKTADDQSLNENLQNNQEGSRRRDVPQIHVIDLYQY